MTSRRKIAVGVLAATLLAGIVVSISLTPHRSQAPALSLAFEKEGSISGWEFDTQPVAFLWLTNSSARGYLLPLVGGTNSFLQDNPFSFHQGSYLVRWELSHPSKPAPPVSFASFGNCCTLMPHSAVRLRIPQPPKGQKVAVLCAEFPPGTPRPFWTHGLGLTVLRILPASVGRRLLFADPAVLKVWCDHEF